MKLNKNLPILFLAVLSTTTAFAASSSSPLNDTKHRAVVAEEPSTESGVDWKGRPDPNQFDFGIVAGLGLVDGSAGFVLAPSISTKILKHGFIEGELNDSVSIEGQGGPVFLTGTTAFMFSAHLRWDFQRNQDWTLFGLGGVGGAAYSGHFEMYPRFGVGAFWNFGQNFGFRFEISHEQIAVGMNFPF
jgi:hypothetical protein